MTYCFSHSTETYTCWKGNCRQDNNLFYILRGGYDSPSFEEKTMLTQVISRSKQFIVMGEYCKEQFLQYITTDFGRFR